jgi:hypothetical protein
MLTSALALVESLRFVAHLHHSSLGEEREPSFDVSGDIRGIEEVPNEDFHGLEVFPSRNGRIDWWHICAGTLGRRHLSSSVDCVPDICCERENKSI